MVIKAEVGKLLSEKDAVTFPNRRIEKLQILPQKNGMPMLFLPALTLKVLIYFCITHVQPIKDQMFFLNLKSL